MRSTRTVFGAVAASALLALAPAAPAAPAVADDPSPSPLPTRAHATVEAEKQLNVGSAAQAVHAGWMFWDGGAQVPAPENETIVIDARGLSGVASVAVDDPRCEADGRVFTCVNTDSSQQRGVEFTLRADAAATPGASGTITYTVSADHAEGATAKAKVVVGVPELVVADVPDVTGAEPGSRIEIPLRLRNTGDLATDRRIMVSWVSAGGLDFDHKFSNCAYENGDDVGLWGSRASVTCVFPVGPDSVPAGATVELSSPLTATVGERVLTAVTDYSVELLRPGTTPGGGRERGTGPALTLVRASEAGTGFEKAAEGQFLVAADNSADLAAEVTMERRGKTGWLLDVSALNHGPASAYGIGDKSVAVVDVVLPEGVVAYGTGFTPEEDSIDGPCVRPGRDSSDPFEPGHRHYVCTVRVGVPAGERSPFSLRVKVSEQYDGAKGTATVRPGPAGVPLHDPDATNDSVPFAFGAATAAPSTDTGRTTLVVTVAVCAVALLAATVMVVRRRGRDH
ncbi:hypothetical protein [Streptomyces sp. S.PB5]|uniref:hypothetical protein n=1 Tax=Streptomyces sp. S.PB5 TaxID=3020844 RepID=UPI0025B0DE1C|nr:hypothetical protein [Streptomyces sp. S.PB5]MDN3020674.1 hypothetical protein [Streptomyces sp. S.PB5]